MGVVQIADAGQEWAFGNHTSRPRTEAIAALRDISTDPTVLGIALATMDLDRLPLYQRLADLYRAAGADEQVAAADMA